MAAGVKCNSVLLLFFLLVIAVMIQPLHGQYDEYWQKRALEAQKATDQSYHPNPEEVTFDFNNQVHQAVKRGNGTRRKNLEGQAGPCSATNPMDQCWRCHPDWNQNRERLADCAIGFGKGTTGGKGGKIYVVTDPSDSDMTDPKPGTLRHAVIQKEPLWITFARSMTIELKQELLMAGDKTIDGRGADVHVANGAGITIQFVKNVIIHGIHIHDIIPSSGGQIRDSVDHMGIRTRADGDGISIFGSTNVWIDHVTMSNCKDGLIDAIMGSTAITISNCHFTHHNDVLLFGANDTHEADKKMQITVAFNHFGEGLIQRMPRCRLGFFHVVNNDYFHWIMYAIGGSAHPTIISQGNHFVAPDDPNFKQVTVRAGAPESEWKNWQWRSEGDVMMNGAFFVQSGPPFNPNQFPNMVAPKPGTFAPDLTRDAGALNCVPNSPC